MIDIQSIVVNTFGNLIQGLVQLLATAVGAAIGLAFAFMVIARATGWVKWTIEPEKPQRVHLTRPEREYFRRDGRNLSRREMRQELDDMEHSDYERLVNRRRNRT